MTNKSIRAFIVKVDGTYLFPSEDGVSFTPDKDAAGHFLNHSEADDTAQLGLGYSPGSYEVIPVDIAADKLIRY